MNITAEHSASLFDQATLRKQLRDAGLLMITCAKTGDLLGPSGRDGDWLSDLFCQSPIFRQALRQATRTWNGQDPPEVLQALPGLWLAPIPLVQRRRITGYTAAAIPTHHFLESEQFSAMCQSSQQDRELTARLLVQLPPAEEAEIPRLAAVVRCAHDAQAHLIGEAHAKENIGHQLAVSYEELNLLYTIIQSMTVVEHPRRFVTIACEELLATLPYAWIGMIFSDDTQRLKRLAGQFVFTGETSHPADAIRNQAQRLLAAARPGEPLVLDTANRPDHAEYHALGANLLGHPITSDNAVLGLLIAGEKQGADTAASSVDMKLLAATASHTAIFVENAALYEDLNAMFLGTLEALTASIDAKDRYTCGHSQRVALLTRQLAEAVGLDEHTVSRMRIAGIVHDVGKIGVPERVLLKPGKLTRDEFAWIRKHPEMGYRILKDIPQFQDILPGVLYHHERWDGGGYPSGLAAEEIPLIARVIALADAFDAMSSSRTYRTRLSRPEVLKEIERCSGAQFDPSLAPVFVQLDFSEFDRLVVEHQALEVESALDESPEVAA